MGGNNPLPFTAPPPALGDFITGSNGELLAAVRDLAQGRGRHISLYIWGEHGSGKTSLLGAACREAKAHGQTIYHVRDGGCLPPPADGCLVVDDVETLDNEAQIQLFDWHNHRAAAAAATEAAEAAGGAVPRFLLAAGTAAPGLGGLREELASRLAAGLVLRLQPLSDTEKNLALAAWAQRQGFTLDAPIAEMLLTRLPRNMHTLTAELAALDDFLLAEKKPLTARRCALWLAQRAPHAQQPPQK